MSSRKPEFLQLETGDDAGAVRDRLAFFARGTRVLIIWPEEGTALNRKLDLVLIQREAMRRALRVAIVTHDPQVAKYAAELNISTFETIGASERGRWKRGRSKVFLGRVQRPADDLPREELKDSVRAEKEEADPRRGGCFWRVFVVGLLLAVGLGAAYVVVPSASVTITPAQERIDVQVQIVADPAAADVNVELGVVPAVTLRVEIEETGTIQTGGTQDMDDALATGSVVFINQTEREITIPAGTTVSTSAGTPILFQTTADALLPAGVGIQLEVPIQAMPSSAGALGNVDSSLINTVIGPLSSDLLVRNLAPTVGGVNRAVKTVTAADRDRLLAMVRQQLQARAYTEMLARLSATQTIIIETLRIAEERDDWTAFSAVVGDAADSLTLTMRAIVQAVAVDELYDRQIAIAQLSARIPRGRALRPDTLDVQRGVMLDADTTSGRITYGVTASGLVVGQVDAVTLQSRLAGRTPDDALRYMQTELDLASDVTPLIQLAPDWLTTLPLLPVRITVIVIVSDR